MAQGSNTNKTQIVDTSANVIGVAGAPIEIASTELKSMIQSLIEEVRLLRELLELKLG